MSPETRPRLPEVSFGPFIFEPNSRLLRRSGVEVPLPPRVIGVLELLLARAGDVIPRQELIDTVWKDAFVTDTSLAEAISFLRQSLADDPQSPIYIQTVHRRGYRFLSPVAALPAPSASSGAGASAPNESAAPSFRELFAWSIALLAVLAAASAGWYTTRKPPVVLPIVQLAIDAGSGLAFDTRAPAIALSETIVVWSACGDGRCDLYVRPFDNAAVRKIEGTTGAAAPFLSPDGRWIGFFADGKLKKVLLQGGSPSVLADAPHAFGAVWMRDGRIVFASSIAGGLLRVSDQGGEIERITQPSVQNGELRHAFPSTTSSADAVIFVAVNSPLSSAGGRLSLLPYGNQRPFTAWRTLAENVTVGSAVGDEFIAYVKGRDIFAQGYDAVRQGPYGPEQLVVQRVSPSHLALSSNGALARASSSAGATDDRPTVWGWSDKPGAAFTAPALLDVSLSSDGTQVAGADAGGQMWTVNLARGTATRLTYGTPSASPVWSADGSRVFYASRRGNAYEIWMRDSGAAAEERRVLASPAHHLFPSSASRDHLAYVETGGTTGADIGILDIASGTSRIVVNTAFDETLPAISPDGSRMAYQSDESGRWEVMLLDVNGGKRQPVSTTGGIRPFWSENGRLLFFESAGHLLKVSVDNGAIGRSEAIYSLGAERVAGMTPAGSLLLQREPGRMATTALVTLQWIRELRRVFGPPPTVLPR